MIFVIIALFAVGGAGFYVYSQQNKNDTVASQDELPDDIDDDEDPTSANGDDQENNTDDTGDNE